MVSPTAITSLPASVTRAGSKFGDNHKWGAFPSVSMGWNIMNEKFMKSTRSWLSNLKLRAGYGVTGVIPGSSYLSMLRYTFSGSNYYRNGSWHKGMKAVSNPNPDLKWEVAKEFNIGVDWSLWDDRFSGSFDFYHKKTSDMLYDYAVPSPPNLYTSTTANVGEMRNVGVELMLQGTPVRTKNFEWNTQITLQHNANKLLSLSNDLYQTDNVLWLQGVGDPVTQYTHKVEVGKSFGRIYSLKAVGVDQNNGLFLIENPKTGQAADFYQEMRNDYDNWYEYIGNGIPSVTMAWNNTFRYKNFDLSLQCNGQFGYYIINQQRVFYENNAHAYNKPEDSQRQDWRHRSALRLTVTGGDELLYRAWRLLQTEHGYARIYLEAKEHHVLPESPRLLQRLQRVHHHQVQRYGS